MLQSFLPWPSSFQVFLWVAGGFLTPLASGQDGLAGQNSLDAAIIPALALKPSILQAPQLHYQHPVDAFSQTRDLLCMCEKQLTAVPDKPFLPHGMLHVSMVSLALDAPEA